MKLISTDVQLNKQLLRLIKTYPKIAFATAWASAGTDIFSSLLKHKENIVGAVVGTHFYQTHPDVLDHFVGSERLKFILQPEGVFHPKVYLFWDSLRWEVIIGSPNLTAAALSRNSELSILITSDDGQPELNNEIDDVIKGYLKMARSITQEEADRYRMIWKLKVRDLKRLSGSYGEKDATKPAVDSRVMSMDWVTFLAEVKRDKTHGYDERIAMLNAVKKQFDQHVHFNDIAIDDRRGIAGLEDSQTIKNAAWFGSMSGAGTFYHLINEGHPAFSLALDKIPLHGEVRKEHYERFIDEYLKAYPNGRDGLGTATRLLAMKRPDTFLCVDSRNKRRLAKDVGLVRADKLDYERYWSEVILRFRDSPWWQSPEPSSSKEKAAWNFRAAMLDAIFYER